MKNLLLTIEFDGREYFGWQEQKDKKTIAGELRNALKEIFKKDIKIVGMGRTDREVSAMNYYANFKIDVSDIDLNILKRRLNATLSEKIYVKEIREVPLKFNARYSVKKKSTNIDLFSLLRQSEEIPTGS